MTIPVGSASVDTGSTGSLPEAPRRSAVLLAFGLLSLATLAVGWMWLRASPRTDVVAPSGPLPVIAPVPDFALTASDGRTVTRADLLGSTWVADFIFTHCTGPCPAMTLRMRSLQETLRERGSDAKLVSISLDPVEDTPAVMAEYARRANADAARWWFLTGTNEKQVHEMVRNGFLQTVQRAAPGLGIVHSAYFLVIDSQGRIRAAHDGTEAESKPKILAAIEALASEKSPP